MSKSKISKVNFPVWRWSNWWEGGRQDPSRASFSRADAEQQSLTAQRRLFQANIALAFLWELVGGHAVFVDLFTLMLMLMKEHDKL